MRDPWSICGFAVGVIISIIVAAEPTHAEVPPWSDEAIDLARICVSEAGWHLDGGDCAAIHAVIETRAGMQGRTWPEMARAYSTRVFDQRRQDPRRWVAHLRSDLGEPRGWPGTLEWWRFRTRWRDRLEQAEAIVQGSVRHRCDRTPWHWGARYGIDRERARRAIDDGRWAPVDCGDTRNAFYRVRGV